MDTKQKLHVFMKHKVKVLTAIALVIVLAAGSIATATNLEAFRSGPVFAEPTGRVFYLSADGNNANNGLTLDTAWRTLQHAESRLQAGDTLMVSSRGGDFTGADRFHPVNGGTAGAPITIRALDNEQPVFRTKPQGLSVFIRLDFGRNHFVFEGLSFIDIGYQCPDIQGTPVSNGNTVARIANAHNISFINNTFDNQLNTDYGANPPIRSNSHIQFWAADNILLRGNYFNGAGFALVHAAASPAASGAVDMVQFQGSRNVLIEHNFFGNGGHAALAFDCLVSNIYNQGRRAENLVVQFNVFANAWGGGFYFGRSFGDAGPGAPANVRNDGLRPGYRPGDGGAPGHYVVQNNIIFNYGAQVNYPKSGITVYANEGHIVRHNIVAYGDDYFGSQSSALGFTAFNGGFGATNSPRRHRIYNNITFRNGGPAVYIAEGGLATARDVEYKNNIFFEDNSPNWTHNNMHPPHLDGQPNHRAQIMLVAHNTNPIPAGQPQTGTFQSNFIDNFPGSHRFINNMIMAPEGRDV